jgi:hypothetical protein
MYINKYNYEYMPNMGEETHKSEEVSKQKDE